MLHIILIVFACVTQIHPEPCGSGKNESNTCPRVVDCSVIITALSLKTMSSDSIYYCDNNKARVCCPRPTPEVPSTEKPVASSSRHVTSDEARLPSSHAAAINDICGIQHSDDYIHEDLVSNKAIITEFPWIARLMYRRKGEDYEESLCTGSLVSRRHVLTAAQCIFDDAKLISTRFGVYHIVTEKDCIDYADIKARECSVFKDYPVKRFIRHEGYNGQNDGVHNIALIILKNEVQFTDYIRPICLIQPDTERPRFGQEIMISGWGWKLPDDNSFWVTKYKLKLKIRIFSQEHCTNLGVSLQQNQLCAIQDKPDSFLERACIYENGGPLMFSYNHRWYQEGIALGGMKNCVFQTPPLIYVNVADYLDWIVQNMKNP